MKVILRDINPEDFHHAGKAVTHMLTHPDTASCGFRFGQPDGSDIWLYAVLNINSITVRKCT